MHGPPMLRDRRPAAQPNTLMPLHVIEQALEGPNPPGATNDSAVQADGQHARTAFAAAPIQPVERVAAIAEKVLSRTEVAPALQTAVVAVKRVWKDELENITYAY